MKIPIFREKECFPNMLEIFLAKNWPKVGNYFPRACFLGKGSTVRKC
jgi:hypothetical protein